jgi:hypothetical protein
MVPKPGGAPDNLRAAWNRPDHVCRKSWRLAKITQSISFSREGSYQVCSPTRRKTQGEQVERFCHDFGRDGTGRRFGRMCADNTRAA